MRFNFQGRKFARDPNVHTPLDLAWYIRDIIAPVLQPRVVLDPCCGAGALSVPWFRDSYTIGFDLRDQSDIRFNKYCQYPFDLLTTWDVLPRPDLVVCNPPFCGAPGYSDNRVMMWPERMLRAVCSLFGNTIPIVLICPHGFRLNQRSISARTRWLSSRDAPKITSIISLPLDIFPETKFHSEVLIFNISGIRPHYWYVPR